jgi:hypothetical protein
MLYCCSVMFSIWRFYIVKVCCNGNLEFNVLFINKQETNRMPVLGKYKCKWIAKLCNIDKLKSMDETKRIIECDHCMKILLLWLGI